MPTSLTEHFKRERVPTEDQGAVVIKSTCRRCGESIISDVADGLAEKELRHVQECKCSEVRQGGPA